MSTLQQKKVVAIIQARMGSSRLPNKVMRPMAGKPMIALLLARLSRATCIDQIVLATSVDERNTPLAEYVSDLGYGVFRGSEEDVLGRFAAAAKQYQADVVVRITGDSPLIDPDICDQLIDFHQQQQADYAGLSERFCEGVDCEVISIDALLQTEQLATLASEREHVTLYTYQHTEQFRCIELDNDSDDSHYRFTVDNLEDAQVLEHIVAAHKDTLTTLNTRQIKAYLQQNPDVHAINSHIVRNEGLLKSLADEQHSNET